MVNQLNDGGSMETTNTAGTTFPTQSNPPGDAAAEASRAAKAAVDRVAKSAHQAVDKMSEAALPAAEWLSDRGDKLKVTHQKLMQDTCEYIGANPMKSVGLAF